MVTKRKKGKTASKKVKSLAARSLNVRQAKAVHGGTLPRMKWEIQIK